MGKNKRTCTFNTELEKDFPFLKRFKEEKDKVHCSHCGSIFSVAHGGRNDINEHNKTNKHQQALRAAAASKPVDSFLKKVIPTKKDLATAAREATFAFHCVKHDHSFKSTDCTSKLISTFYDPKFTCAKDKSQAIVVKVITPMVMTEIQSELEKVQFVCVSIDASNRKELKIVPIIVRYFMPREGIKVKLLDLYSVPGETSEILAGVVRDCLSKNLLEGKIVAYCADNTNTNFGGVKRAGKKNVFTKLKEITGRDLIGIGCGAHIIHNCIQTAVDLLPLDVEAIVVKIYKYFHIYTVRVIELKEFCEFSGIEYKKLLKHGNTRFLSLGPALQRLLLQYSGLKSYFLSQEKCPATIRSFFEDEVSEFWLWFVHGQLSLFEGAIGITESEDFSATEAASVIHRLKSSVTERKNCMFIPFNAKQLKFQLLSNNLLKTSSIERTIMNFYTSIIEYLNLWTDSFGGSEKFDWIRLQTTIEWGEVEASVSYINTKLSNLQRIDSDLLFDEMACVKEFATPKLKGWNDSRVAVQERWKLIFENFHQNTILCPNLELLVQFVLCLPGTSTPVERIFSLMNNAWTPEKSNMEIETVKAVLQTKVNVNLSCTQFHEKIRESDEILNRVHSSEKYKKSVETQGIEQQC